MLARRCYIDPDRHRAGLPEDVAALVDRLSDKETGITLVNISPLATRTVIIQGRSLGGTPLRRRDREWQKTRINASSFTVELASCRGAHLVVSTKRYVNPPTMSFRGKATALSRSKSRLPSEILAI